MKTRIFSFFFSILFVLSSMSVFGSGKPEKSSKQVTVYAYDSFTADWGPGPEIVARFEAKTGIKVNLVSCGDAAQVLSRAVLEKKNPKADVLVGLDNNLVEKARSEAVLASYKPALADFISPDLRLSDDWLLTPYDWGYFAFIFDTASPLAPPKSLEDLTDKRFNKKLIIMDPRMSTPGLGFLVWTMKVYGSDWQSYWERLKPSILTLAPGWDTGYGLFTSGEAPLVISYTTSPAYHVEYDKTERYQALIFDQGHVTQIEGLGLVKGAKNTKEAQAFIDFMLTDEAQSIIPLTQWMYPVSKTVVLPESFKAAPFASKNLATDTMSALEISSAVQEAVSILAR